MHRKTHDTAEAIKAEIDGLREEIQSLVLDRVWALRKESETSVEVHPPEGHESRLPPRFGEPGPERHEAFLHRNGIPVNREPCQELIPYSPNPLAALDASLSEIDPYDSTISQQTFSRSDNAVDYLVDHWTVMITLKTQPQAHGGQDNTTNTINEPGISDHRSSSASNGVILKNEEKVDDCGTEKDFATKLLPRFWIETVTRQLPPEISNRSFPGLVWTLDSQKYSEIVSTEDAFHWQICARQYKMHLVAQFFIACTKVNRYYTECETYLPYTWFEKSLLSRRGYMFKSNPLSWSGTPLV